MIIFLNIVASGVYLHYATCQQIFCVSNHLKTLKMFLSEPMGGVNVMNVLVVAASLWSKGLQMPRAIIIQPRQQDY